MRKREKNQENPRTAILALTKQYMIARIVSGAGAYLMISGETKNEAHDNINITARHENLLQVLQRRAPIRQEMSRQGQRTQLHDMQILQS